MTKQAIKQIESQFQILFGVACGPGADGLLQALALGWGELAFLLHLHPPQVLST